MDSVLNKWSRFLLVLILVTAWVFSGWPRFWEFPNFPPEIKKVDAVDNFTDPDGDVGPNEATANTCGSAAHFTCIDDGVRFNSTPSTSGDVLVLSSATTADQERFTLDNSINDVGTATEVAIYLYHYNRNTNVQTRVEVFSQGSQIGSTINLPQITSAGWGVATTSAVLSLDQTDIDDLEVLVTCFKPGGGGNSNCYVFEAYAQIVYTPPANNPPNQPVNSSPANASSSVSVNPTFIGSTYSDSDSDPQTDAEWRVDDDSDFSSPVWTRTAGGAEDTIVLNSSNGTFANELSGQTQLAYSTKYYWQVRYSDGTDWSDWSAYTDFTTQAVSVSVTLDISDFAYGSIPENTASSTLTLFSGVGIIATNDGGATSDFDIYGSDTNDWTLSASNGSDQYVHEFCNDSDNDCSSPPTNYTALTTSPQTLKNNITVSGTVNFQLRVTTPSISSVYTEQSAVVTVQASAS